jgi:hypothetical protein
MIGRACDVNIKIPPRASLTGRGNPRSITTFILKFEGKALKIKNKKPLG